MTFSICLITTGSTSTDRIAPMLVKSGLSVWTCQTLREHQTDSRCGVTQCLIIDLEDNGLELVNRLRSDGIRCPALLVTDCRPSPVQMAHAGLLDVLARPVDMRILLSWIECLCAAYMVVERRGQLAGDKGTLAIDQIHRTRGSQAEPFKSWSSKRAANG